MKNINRYAQARGYPLSAKTPEAALAAGDQYTTDIVEIIDGDDAGRFVPVDMTGADWIVPVWHEEHPKPADGHCLLLRRFKINRSTTQEMEAVS